MGGRLIVPRAKLQVLQDPIIVILTQNLKTATSSEERIETMKTIQVILASVEEPEDIQPIQA